MKITFLSLFLSIQVIVFSQDNGINFKEGTWKDALASAKQAEKPLFLYISSLACTPCREMEKNVFPNPEVSEYYNKTFIDFKASLDEDEGAALGKQFNIASMPSYLYFDKEGRLLHISRSGKSAEEFLRDGKNAFDSTKAYMALKERYERGDYVADFLFGFTETLENVSGAEYLLNKVAGEYLSTQNEEALTSKKNLEFIFHSSTDFFAPATAYYLKYQKELKVQFSETELDARTRLLITSAAHHTGSEKDAANFDAIKNTLTKSLGKESEQWVTLVDVTRLGAIFIADRKNWEPYADATIAYGRKYVSKDNYTLRYTATLFNYYIDEKEGLQKALQIVDQVIAVDKNYDNLLLRAKLLHKLGHKKKAAIAANSAVQVATPKDDTQNAKDLLEEIKKSTKK